MVFNFIKSYIKNPQLYKFTIVGAIGSAIVMLFTYVFTSYFGIAYWISAIFALEISLIGGFYLHEKWTFVNISKHNKSRKRFLQYNVFSLIGFGINEIILIFFTEQLEIHYLTSEMIAIVITFFFNFAINKKITWK